MNLLPFLLGTLLPFAVLSLVGLALLSRWRPAFVPEGRALLLAPAVGVLPIAAGTFVLWVTDLAEYVHVLSALLLALVVWRGRAVWKLLRAVDRGTLVVLAVLLSQCLASTLHHEIYRRANRNVDPIWDVYRATGVAPPDQLFAWHQALFIEQRGRYPTSEFYGDIDLYDRPHFGGFLTFFFVKHVPYGLSDPGAPPIPYHRFNYDEDSLAWYRALWSLLNGLYVLGVALLVPLLLGARAGLVALAVTSLSGQFLLSITGAWVKFASVYPLVAATALVITRSSPVLAGLLGAEAFHLHPSSLPFLASLSLFALWRAARAKVEFRGALVVSALLALFVVPWFVVPRLLGSKQPLAQYYLYDAGVTEAQTIPRSTLRERFYTAPLHNLALLPTYNALRGLLPFPLLEHVSHFTYRQTDHVTLESVSTAIGQSEQSSLTGVLGLWALPSVVAGGFLLLRRRRGTVWLLFASFLPTLYMAVLYRKDDIFKKGHIMSPFHLVALTCACLVLARWPRRRLLWALLFAWTELQLVLFVGRNRFFEADATLTFAQLFGKAWLPWLALQAVVFGALALLWRELRIEAGDVVSVGTDDASLLSGGRGGASVTRALSTAAAMWIGVSLAYALLIALKPL